MTLSYVRAQIRNQYKLSDFETAEGLRQGDPLATLLFNIVLTKAVRSSHVDTSGSNYGKSSQLNPNKMAWSYATDE